MIQRYTEYQCDNRRISSLPVTIKTVENYTAFTRCQRWPGSRSAGWKPSGIFADCPEYFTDGMRPHNLSNAMCSEPACNEIRPSQI